MARNTVPVDADSTPSPPEPGRLAEGSRRAAAFLSAYVSAARMCLYAFTLGVARPESRALIKRLAEMSRPQTYDFIWTSGSAPRGMDADRLIPHESGPATREGGVADER